MLTILSLSLLFKIADVSPPDQAQLPIDTAKAIRSSVPAFVGTLDYFDILPGTAVPASRVPLEISSRANLLVDATLGAALRPTGPRPWIGNRDAPTFEHEYLRLGWVADGRHIVWSDFDPGAGILIQLKPGEIDTSSDEAFRDTLMIWLQSNLLLPRLPRQPEARVLKRASIDETRNVAAAIVSIYRDGDNLQMFDIPPKDNWATMFQAWTDGHYLFLGFSFTSGRPQGLPSPSGHRKQSLTKSRFDP